MKKISIVAPMYNEEEMANLFYEAITNIVKKIEDKYEFEFVIVNDGSRDKTLNILKDLKSKDSRIHLISFSRNYGHEAAICAGMKEAKGDAVIIMDSDLQDPPEVIYDLLNKYEEGYEVVNGKRGDRKKDSFLKRFTAEKYYDVIYKLSGKIKVPKNIGNFRLISRKVLDYINALPEKSRVFRVIVPYVGFKTTEVEFVRPKRPKGESKYNYKSMFSLAGDSIVSSSPIPLKWAMKVGLYLTPLSFIGLITFLILWILDANKVISISIDNKFFFLLCFIMLFFGIVFIFLGIIGEYLARIFREAQDRPLYFIDEDFDSEMKKD